MAGTQSNAERRTEPTGEDAAPRPPGEIPGPDGLPFVGSTLSVLRDGVGFSERVAEHGDVVSYRLFGREFVAVSDPAAIEAVLVSRNDEFRKGEFETAAGRLVAPSGLAFTEGEQCRRQRTLLQPMFTPDRVRGYASEAVAAVDRLVDGWSDGQRVELTDAFGRLTLDVLARTLFDVELGADRGAVVRRAGDAVQRQLSLGPSMLLPAWLPTPGRRRYERAMADLDDLVGTLVAAADEDGDDLLSLLATATHPDGSEPTTDEVRDQLVTFLFAGHETTSLALTHAVRALADAPEQRRRLRAELDDRLDGPPTFADLGDLPYLGAVTDEVLRLYPPVYSVYREPVEPTTLAGYEVTPDHTLQLSTFNVHRDGRWYDEPERFRPGRWLDERDRPEYAYFPFGGGPRHCIGMRFARMEFRLALATLLRRVRFDVLEDPGLAMQLLLQPDGDVPARVAKR
jgi:cytochrome P450